MEWYVQTSAVVERLARMVFLIGCVEIGFAVQMEHTTGMKAHHVRGLHLVHIVVMMDMELTQLLVDKYER